jgi:hypothetical protein
MPAGSVKDVQRSPFSTSTQKSAIVNAPKNGDKEVIDPKTGGLMDARTGQDIIEAPMPVKPAAPQKGSSKATSAAVSPSPVVPVKTKTTTTPATVIYEQTPETAQQKAQYATLATDLANLNKSIQTLQATATTTANNQNAAAVQQAATLAAQSAAGGATTTGTGTTGTGTTGTGTTGTGTTSGLLSSLTSGSGRMILIVVVLGGGLYYANRQGLIKFGKGRK